MTKNRMLGLAMSGLLAASALAPIAASAAAAGQDAGHQDTGRQERGGDDRGRPDGQGGRPGAGPGAGVGVGVTAPQVQAQARAGGRQDARGPDGYPRGDRGPGQRQGYPGQPGNRPQVQGGPGQQGGYRGNGQDGFAGQRYGQPGGQGQGQPQRPQGDRDQGYAGRPGGPGYGAPGQGYRGGQQYGGQQYRGQQGGWNRGWRQDRRFDWSGYRQQNRQAFGLPRYTAPYGWRYGYRRFDVGVSLNAALFGRSYWIANPWAYRLPPAYGDLRWVRYYNDALLVDLNSGQVVDTVYGIFY